MSKPSTEMHLTELSQLYKWWQGFYCTCLEVFQKITWDFANLPQNEFYDYSDRKYI